jgi:hypothetical protein
MNNPKPITPTNAVRSSPAAPPIAALPREGTLAWLEAMIERGKTNIFAVIAPLNVTIARDLVDRWNDNNRTTAASKIAQYAADMAAGRWQFNGETVIIAEDGHMNDGQHRARAVILADVEIPVLWVFGLSRESRHSLDQGLKRTAGHILAIQGVKSANLAAPVARAVVGWELSDGRAMNQGRNISQQEIIDRAVKDPAIAAATDFAVQRQHGLARVVVGSVIGFAHVVLSRIDPGDAANFLNRLIYGEGLKRGTAVYALRERLNDQRPTRDRSIALIFRAWNMHRRDARGVTRRQLHETLPLPVLRTGRGEAAGESPNSEERPG